jgi:hypothetical protein
MIAVQHNLSNFDHFWGGYLGDIRVVERLSGEGCSNGRPVTQTGVGALSFFPRVEAVVVK